MDNDLQKFDELQSQITMFVAPARDVVVDNQESSADASKALRELAAWEKKVEAKRVELVGPLNDQVKRINEYAKQIAKPLGTAKDHVKNELLKYERVLEAQRQEALRIEREERIKREAAARQKIIEEREAAEAKARALKEDAETLAMFAEAEVAEEATIQAEIQADLVLATHQAEANRIEFEAKKQGWDAKKEIAQNKVEGTRRTWTYRVTDETQIPKEFTITSIDEKKLKRLIAAGLRDVPGLHIYQEITITSR